MRILIAIVAALIVGLGVRALNSPAVQEITAPAPSYSESHAETVALAEAKAAELKAKSGLVGPVNPAFTEPLEVRGYVVRGKRANVILSDGTTWTETLGGLELIERSHVMFRGKAYAIRGSGAKGAPVRPDTEVPGVAIPVITDRSPIVAEEFTGPAARANESTPPLQQQGSWYVDRDGVNRLREVPKL